MKTVEFTKTDLRVSPLSLGTVNYGTSTPEADAFSQMDRYAEAGNFIDTAHVYGDWVPGETARSERVVGRWLKSRGMRGKIVISSKGGHPRLDGSPFIGRLRREELFSDAEESLACLGVDAIDMYFLHRDDARRPVGEILETLEALRAQGKIRHYGCSNWTLPRIEEARAYADTHEIEGFTCNQLMWSLARVNRENVKDKTLVSMDEATYAHHAQTRLSAMAYMSVAKGYFSHKAAGTKARPSAYAVYDSPENDAIERALREISSETGKSVTELSLQYFMDQPFPSVAIASFSNPSQLEQGLAVLTSAPDEALARRVRALRGDLIAK